jgi:hypothetical protein
VVGARRSPCSGDGRIVRRLKRRPSGCEDPVTTRLRLCPAPTHPQPGWRRHSPPGPRRVYSLTSSVRRGLPPNPSRQAGSRTTRGARDVPFGDLVHLTAQFSEPSGAGIVEASQVSARPEQAAREVGQAAGKGVGAELAAGGGAVGILEHPCGVVVARRDGVTADNPMYLPATRWANSIQRPIELAKQPSVRSCLRRRSCRWTGCRWTGCRRCRRNRWVHRFGSNGTSPSTHC